MARDIYIRETRSENRLLRRILILLLVIILLGGGAFGYLIIREQRASEQALLAYATAIDQDDYETALPLYRDIQEKALTGGFLGRNRELYDDARVSMEALTRKRLAGIEAQLRSDRPLSASDLQFVEKMSEVTAVTMSTLVRSMCEEYLTGRIERSVLAHALEQLAGLENLKVPLDGLSDQLEKMTKAQPAIRTSLADLKAGRYLAAAAALKALAADESTGTIVRQSSAKWLDDTRKAMYQPLLDEIERAMTGARYVTASAAINDLMVYFPDDDALKTRLATCKSRMPAKLVPYRGTVEQIVIKPLIVNPAAAFDGDSYAKAADDSMLTTSEFARILDGLYKNQYVLIDATRLADTAGKPLALDLPEGKKPLVLTIEGLNYYATRRKTGNSDNLVLDDVGQVSGRYTDQTGQVKVDRKAEAIGILDAFVEAHPDFSHDGAKGTITLTGYECVFGYITDADQNDDRSQALAANGLPAEIANDAEIAANKETVARIVARLKQTGWIFGSSTYGFIDARSQPLDRIKADTEKWLAQVGSLTGPVRILHYPNGAFINGSDERARYLMGQGFTIFGGIGVTAYQFAGNGYLYVDKTPLNGYTLRNSAVYQLNRLFNPVNILDGSRPKAAK